MTVQQVPFQKSPVNAIQGGVSQMVSPNMSGVENQLTQDNSIVLAQMKRGRHGFNHNQPELIAGNVPLSSNVREFKKSNVYKAMVYLINKKGWTAEFAAAWLGQAAVETGNYDLSDLDVVEGGSGAGRGMFQYTGSRRWPYDTARHQALSGGQNPNSIEWQIDYALNKDNPAMNLDAMREGLTDPDKDYRFNRHWGTATGVSPTGERYGNRFNTANALMAAYGKDKLGGYSRALAGEYTRPGTIHLDRRMQASKHYFKMYNRVKSEQRRRGRGPVTA